MPFSRTVAAALAASTLAAPALAERREEYTRVVEKTVALEPGQRVEVSHRHGDVVVRGVPGSELKVAARIRVSADAREEADRYGAAIDVHVEERPQAVRVSTVYPLGRWR
ncbi:MAG TPA: hypothetical protein VF310_14730, partial [Vicinamibacteria bacterium]